MAKVSHPPAPDLELQMNLPESERGPDDDAQAPALETADTHQFPDISRTRAILLVVVLSLAALLTVLNSQSIVIILPQLGSVMLLWGRLADVYGRRLGFLSGSIIFTLSTLCLPWSRYEIPFYVLRAVQGMSAAAIMPSAIGITASTFAPGPSRNMAYIALSAMASLGSVIGSLLGGFVGSALGWKWVFWIPAAASACITVSGFVATAGASMHIATQAQIDHREGRKRPYVDWIGGLFVSCSLTLLLVVMTQANVIGWSTPWIPPLLIVSLLILGGFVFYQRRLERDPDRLPLIRMSLFKKKKFSALFVLVGCFYASFNGFLVFVTYFYQNYEGLDQLQTTLRFLPAGVSGLLISFAVFPALNHLPYFLVLTSGLLFGILSPLIFAVPSIPPNTAYWAWGFPAMCFGMSVEIVWPVFSLLTAKSLPQEDQSLGGGLLQTVNNVGRALGLAVATAVQTSIYSDTYNFVGSDEYLRGLRAAQWVNFALAATSMMLALAFFRGSEKA
ncbi:drug resistance [Fusarium beomiforme]|uniref:Drug resistance n=1 Tax=Fusarium beomiforme TaxID=44412 RepID=A0A9P5E027_9HYPO|nr:drug resistance [Fusarium beomiforme]